MSIIAVCENHYNKYENETDLADIAFEFECGWQSNPIFSAEGDYPEIMRQRVDSNSELEHRNSSRLPIFTKEWIEYIK